MVQSKKRKSEDEHQVKSGGEKSTHDGAAFQTLVTGVGLTLFDEVEDYAVLLLDPVGKVLYWNKGARQINGYEANEIIGKNYRIFYPSEDRDTKLPDDQIQRARDVGSTSSEGWRVRKNGTRFWASVSLTALRDDGGKVKGFLEMTKDLTDKKTSEDSHANLIEALQTRIGTLEQISERYYSMIQEVQDYGIVLLDPDGLIQNWNTGAERLKGYTADEIIGKHFRLFYPSDERRQRVPEKLLAEAAKNGSVRHDGWCIRKDGSRFWGNVTLTALHKEDGTLIGFSKFTRDFTDRKIAEDRMSIVVEELRQANEQLRMSEERYHRMVAEVQDYAIFTLDRNGYIQNWNAGAEMIKGFKSEEIVGRSFRIFYTPEDVRKKVPDTLLEKATRYGRASHEGWRVRKDGTRFWGSIVVTALHNPTGEVIGFSKVTRDLTEKKAAEDLLRTSAAQLDLKNKTLERLNEELSSFTHVASHDMKEPLRKILTFAGRIEASHFDPGKSREYLTKIEHAASGMRRLIDDLLSYSQISNDTLAGFVRVDLGAIVSAVLSDLEIAINEKQAVIECKRMPIVRGVPHQLHQMFLNLLSNALKFSKNGTSPRITLMAEIIRGPDLPGGLTDGNNKYHHIAVADNGIGFPQDAGDRIFDAFQRLHPRQAFAGSGLGLAIVKRVVDNHNGIIAAEGRPDDGACFHVYLPAG